MENILGVFKDVNKIKNTKLKLKSNRKTLVFKNMRLKHVMLLKKTAVLKIKYSEPSNFVH
jgi:hypothetical protein